MPKAKKSRLKVDTRNPITRFTGHAYLNLDGTVNGQKLLEIVKHTPGAFD